MFRKKPKIDPREEQLSKLQEIGSQLQQIRTEQGISLETITKQTRIPLRLLKAIESADLDALPEPIYIRGLIKQFAEFLGTEGADLASAFPADLSVKSTRSYLSLRLPGLHLRPIHLYFLYILLVFFSVKGISNVLKQSALEINGVEQPSQRIASAKPSPKTKTSRSSVPVKSQPDQPVIVNLKLKNPSWIKVVVDGKTQFEGILPEGTQRTWVANKQVTVRAGNAGGVLITFNDGQSKELGKPGQPQEITFQAKSLP